MASASCLVTPLQLISEKFRNWMKRDKRRPKSRKKSKKCNEMPPAKPKELKLNILLEALEMGSSHDTAVSMARTSSFKKTPNHFDYDEEDSRCQDSGITEADLMPSDQAEQQERIDIYHNDNEKPFEVDHLQFAHEACMIFENGPLVEYDSHFVVESKTLIEAEHHTGLIAQSPLTAIEVSVENFKQTSPSTTKQPTHSTNISASSKDLVFTNCSFSNSFENKPFFAGNTCLAIENESLIETDLVVESDVCLQAKTELFVKNGPLASKVCLAIESERLVDTEPSVEADALGDCDACMESNPQSFSVADPLVGPMTELSNFAHDRIAQPDAVNRKPNLKKAKSIRDRVLAITNKEGFLYFSEMILILWNELCPIYPYKSSLSGTPEPFPRLDIQPFSEVAGPLVLMEEKRLRANLENINSQRGFLYMSEMIPLRRYELTPVNDRNISFKSTSVGINT